MFLAACMLWASSASAAGAPLCDWLDGLGAAAQARLEGREEASILARRALAARPRGMASARASLELGLAQQGGDDRRDAVALLKAAASSASPATRSAVLTALGTALGRAGDHRAAAEAFRAAAAEGTGAVAERARWRAAEALHAGGYAAEAASAWRALSTGPLAEGFDPATRLAFALDLRATGDRGDAARILRAIWNELPERDQARAAEEALDRWRADGDPIPPFAAEERIARAYRLVAMGRAATAGDELALAERATPPPSPSLLALARATVLLALGRSGEATEQVLPHAASSDPGVRRGVSLILARAASRERRFQDAIAAWSEVAKGRAAVPGLQPSAQASLRDDAEFLAAWLRLDAGDLDGAAAALARLARERPRSTRADDARWFAAWALVRKGAIAEADEALRRLEPRPRGLQATYWRARIATDPTQRVALLRAVAAGDPFGYYPQLARARLEASGAPCDPPPLAPGPEPVLDPLPEAARLRQAAELASAGLREEAIQELTTIARPNGGRTGGRRAAPAAAELAAFLGDPLLPFRVARDQVGLTRRSLRWSFPDAWPSLVAPAARSAGLDAALLRAVMRRESGFRPEARSPAGAAGLLQIVPRTSARLGALLGLAEPPRERALEPSVNVPLGAAYLGLLLERFGEPILAVAAYNAGPNAVLRWTADRAGTPIDAWVESIPFRETRDYVRAVLENWAGARAAAGEPPPAIDPDRAVAPPTAGVAF